MTIYYALLYRILGLASWPVTEVKAGLWTAVYVVDIDGERAIGGRLVSIAFYTNCYQDSLFSP